MFYYYVWVRSSRYHGSEPLTYASNLSIRSGSIVEVELQKLSVLGVVSGPAPQPRFKTKEIISKLDLPPLPSHLLKLANWLMEYYPAPLGIITQQLIPANFAKSQLQSQTIKPTLKPQLDNLPPLTNEQSNALKSITSASTYLLHGATGSGKTRIYIELAYQNLLKRKSSVILTPEISLTTQLANNFKQVFGDRVIVIHSKQTPNERQKAWLNCLSSKEPLIVIGPRSALFVPLNNIGLIVMDESHESAYKQEQSPQYLTSRVAAYLANINRAQLILGSATPLVTDYFLAEQKNRAILKLPHVALPTQTKPTKISLVDRKDHSLFSRSPYLSQTLINQIEETLSHKLQTLLYLNRRGTARLVLCENCGWQATCPHCDIPLTYHGDSHYLRCHSCNYHTNAPSSCPACKHPSVVFKTAGTKAIVDEVKRLFPNAVVKRFDTDNLKADSFEQNYMDAHDAKIDILVGTQMLAKGLDLPKLSTVGILLADTSLYLPDFSAQERTFQLINQVLGRIGRGHVAGHAVIQSYHPDHPIIKLATSSNYADFYKQELKSRKDYLFPPFCYLLKLSIKRASLKSAEDSANKLKSEIQNSYKVRVEGPAPSFYERPLGKYQWQLVVKSLDRLELIKIIKNLPANWSYDIDPMDLL